jgi:Transposase DDE domain
VTLEEIAREVLEEAAEVDAAEDALFGDARGDELPDDLVDPKTRRARLRELLGELEAEQHAERQARRDMLGRRAERERRAGRRPRGRPPIERPQHVEKVRRVNVTDPDSRSVRTPRGFIQGYNAQLVAADGQIIVAAEITTATRDQGHLQPLVTAARAELDAAGSEHLPRVVVADAGYWNNGQIRSLDEQGLRVPVPPDGHNRRAPLPGKRGGLYQQMRDRLAAEDAAALYRRRMTMIEPIFGQTKTNRRADRFQRRGLAAVRSEWRLIAATHNLLKAWRAASAPVTA